VLDYPALSKFRGKRPPFKWAAFYPTKSISTPTGSKNNTPTLPPLLSPFTRFIAQVWKMRLCDDHRRHTWAFSFLLAKPNQVAQTTSEDCELCAVGRHAFLALESVWPDMPESALSFEAKSRDVLENVEIFTTNGTSISLKASP
jgi:hypothetical protein